MPNTALRPTRGRRTRGARGAGGPASGRCIARRVSAAAVLLSTSLTGCVGVGWLQQRAHEAGMEPIGEVAEVAAGGVGGHGWRFVTYISSEGETTRWYRDGSADGDHVELHRPRTPRTHDQHRASAWCDLKVVRVSAQVAREISQVDVVVDGAAIDDLRPVHQAEDAPWGLVATVIDGVDREVELIARADGEGRPGGGLDRDRRVLNRPAPGHVGRSAEDGPEQDGIMGLGPVAYRRYRHGRSRPRTRPER